MDIPEKLATLGTQDTIQKHTIKMFVIFSLSGKTMIAIGSFCFWKNEKKQQKNNHFRRYYIVKIIYVNTSTKIHQSDKLLGYQFCLFLRFWYLILELFRQCGIFCFSCYWCKQKSWWKHISGWITRASIHVHLDL